MLFLKQLQKRQYKKEMKKPSIELFRKVLEAKGGNITQTARALNVERSTLYSWCEKDEKVKTALAQEKESHLDFLESQKKLLQKGIPEYEEVPDPNDERKTVKQLVGWKVKPSELLIIFDLKTLGKNRGYSEHFVKEEEQEDEVILPDIPELEEPEDERTEPNTEET